MSLINIVHLTFGYEGSWENIFEDVSFQIDTNWKLGFTGRNGRGKTTFLQLLLGKYEYSGTISSSVSFDYFPFAVEHPEENTVNVMETVCPDCAYWKIQRELSLLEVDEEVLYRPFSTLSNGEQTKVLLAALFLKEHNFLLIDEPTNHLDLAAREKVGQYLSGKRGFILVSHDRVFLDRCVDHILSINKQNIEIQKGNFSSWLENKERQDRFEQAENDKLKRDIKKLSAAARRTKEWGDQVEATKIGKKSMAHEKSIDTRAYIGEKSRRMQQRRKNLERRQQKAIAEKEQLLKNVDTADSLKLHPLPYHKQVLLEARDLSLSYDGRPVCEHISFTVHSGDRVALSGKNGCGKSSLLKLILGEDIPHTGTLTLSSGLILSSIPQDTSHLCGNLREFAEQSHIDESLFKAILRKLDFSRTQFEKSMEEFSGGQKKKVLLTKSLCESAHLYLWDEPLNFIDVLSRIQIEHLIEEFQPTMLFVEHDSSFHKIATKTVTL